MGYEIAVQKLEYVLPSMYEMNLVIMRQDIPADEIHIDTARSGGPGGQNVNKVESKVLLRWNVGASAVFTFPEKEMIRRALASRINDIGEVMIDVGKERSQAQNRAIAIERLNELVADALVPKKKRRVTRPTHSSTVKRLEEKKKVSERKQRRTGNLKLETV